jgi:polyisoprenoid-binding protein YceI
VISGVRGRFRDFSSSVTIDDAQPHMSAVQAVMTREVTLDRRDFGLNWNEALEAGGVVVGNQVKIVIDTQVVQT